MNSAQESKNELEAAIRYAENAISSAKTTIESMEFRQEMAQKSYQEQTGREKALQNQVSKLKSSGALLEERYDEMKDAAFASRKTIEHLKDKVQGQYDDIKQLERDLTVKTSQAEAWKKEYDKLKGEVEFYTKKYNELAQQKDVPTMPVIPKDVAIAIFREGLMYGASNVCDELDNADSIMVEDSDHVGNFEVSFSMYVDLNDHLDLDFLRSAAVDNADEEWVVDCLNDLCADNKFECRIHGLDDTTIDLTKKND